MEALSMNHRLWCHFQSRSYFKYSEMLPEKTCEWENCNQKFKRPEQLFQHVNQVHSQVGPSPPWRSRLDLGFPYSWQSFWSMDRSLILLFRRVIVFLSLLMVSLSVNGKHVVAIEKWTKVLLIRSRSTFVRTPGKSHLYSGRMNSKIKTRFY